jgi:hypothetical protein
VDAGILAFGTSKTAQAAPYQGPKTAILPYLSITLTAMQHNTQIALQALELGPWMVIMARHSRGAAARGSTGAIGSARISP